MISAAFTKDALFGGALSIRQPARGTGYRINVDAILLAAFAARRLDGPRSDERTARHAVDLGAGVGAVGLTLLHLGAVERVTMVEIDDGLAELARVNAEDNGWSGCVEVVRASAAQAAEGLLGAADLVVSNPPFVPPGRGRAPRARVRTAKYGALETFLEAARKIVGRRARACFVYPAIEATSLLGALRAHGLEPKRLRAVHGRADDDARVVLVEATSGKAGGLAIEPPFVETDRTGARGEALASLLTVQRAPPA